MRMDKVNATKTLNGGFVKIGSKVYPKGDTRKGLTYGYVREVWTGTEERDGRSYIGTPFAYVYWPEIRSAGRWPVDQLEVA